MNYVQTTFDNIKKGCVLICFVLEILADLAILSPEMESLVRGTESSVENHFTKTWTLTYFPAE
jgi:hypothetical protein